jgi:hypothetical protein
LEILAPAGTSSPYASELTAQLGDRGENLYSIAFGVEDVAATAARARELGLPVHDDVAQREGATEIVVGDFIGLKLIASEPTGARRRAALTGAPEG